MNHDEARALLSSRRSHQRLRAARFLERNATADDIGPIKTALSGEQTHWVARGLQRALATATADSLVDSHTATPSDAVPEGSDDDQTYTDAFREAAGLLVHELEPIIGRIRLFSRKTLDEQSPLAREVDRLAACVRAIDTLSRATDAPVLVEFDLAGLISDVSVKVSEELLDNNSRRWLSLDLSGPTPFLVVGDTALIELAVTNGVKNALEATLPVASSGTTKQVLVSWGKTETEYFVRVLDEGVGLPPGAHKAFDIGTSTKKGHLGMGLPVVARAMETLRGRRVLEPRDPDGARLTIAWSRSNGKSSNETASD